jgi:hypothetical protein
MIRQSTIRQSMISQSMIRQSVYAVIGPSPLEMANWNLESL